MKTSEILFKISALETDIPWNEINFMVLNENLAEFPVARWSQNSDISLACIELNPFINVEMINDEFPTFWTSMIETGGFLFVGRVGPRGEGTCWPRVKVTCDLPGAPREIILCGHLDI